MFQDRLECLVLRSVDIAIHLYCLVHDEKGQEHREEERSVSQAPELFGALPPGAQLYRRRLRGGYGDLRGWSLGSGC